MRHLYTIVLLTCFAICAMAETEFTFTSASDMNQTKDGYTLAIAQGSGSMAPTVTMDYQTQTPEMRLYVGNTITVSGENLTDIQMVCSKASSEKDYAELSANTGTLDSGGASTSKTDLKVDHWTGSATQVVFTLVNGKQRQIKRIVINGEPVVIDTTATVLPTAEDLDPNYTYAEPTDVLPKDTVIWKDEYAFIHNNILVHCDMGSIVKATDTTFAYFNCNANYTITFTATQPMKGLEIDGYVRKAFDATCDHGTLQFLTDPDFEMEGWPALVILDIDHTSVTLSCPKQFRCYGARAYFQTNPEPLYPEEGIEHTDATIPAAKILRDGQLLILKNGRIFTTAGTEIQ